jgi:predicted nucleic acid-binding protein
MRFWDSSAIIPLILSEKKSEAMRELQSDSQPLIVWWSTVTEVASALCRIYRHGNHGEINTGLQTYQGIIAAGQIVPPSEEILNTAERLLRMHPLRAADAQQLAAAIVASENQPSTLPFVCLDDRLSEAARKEGFTVI